MCLKQALTSWHIYLQSLISFATDFGTNVGLADFTTMDPAWLLPPWINNGVMELDGDRHVQAATCQYVFENPSGVPGLLHISASAAN